MGQRKKIKKNRELQNEIMQGMFDFNYKVPNETFKISSLKSRNENQKFYLDLLNNNNQSIVLASGPAGTGKTYFATYIGLFKLLNNECSSLILTRPVSSVDEDIGFLPGTLEEKMNPWIKPIYDILLKFIPQQTIEKMIYNQVIEICPLAFMRGRTFSNAWIIADEMQNSTPNQMKMLLTRLGNNSKIVVTGDLQQTDKANTINGLQEIVNLSSNARTKYISNVVFTEKDVQRSNVVREVLSIYKS